MVVDPFLRSSHGRFVNERAILVVPCNESFSSLWATSRVPLVVRFKSEL